MLTEDSGGCGRGCSDSALLDNSNVVSTTHGNVDRLSPCHSESEEPASTPAFNGNSPAPEKTETDGLSLVWKHYENAGISNDVLEVIKNS